MNQKGLKPIAVIEASKGLLALIISLGLHQLMGENIQQVAENLLTHLHFNPANHLPSVFLHAIDNLTDTNLMLLAIGAFVYSLSRFFEAYGIWHKYIWIEWFALISGGIYLPIEMYEFISRTDVLSFSILLINLLMVLYLYAILKSQSSKKANTKK